LSPQPKPSIVAIVGALARTLLAIIFAAIALTIIVVLTLAVIQAS